MKTRHAQIRMSQRGVPEKLVDTLWANGRVSFCRGAEIYTFHSCCRDLDLSVDEVEKLQKLYLVVVDGQLITCAYRRKNFRLH